MFLLTNLYVGFLSAKVLWCNGLIHGGLIYSGGGLYSDLCAR